MACGPGEEERAMCVAGWPLTPHDMLIMIAPSAPLG